MLTTVSYLSDMFTAVSESFRDWLLKAMESKGLSQADLARATGLTTGGISHIVNQSRAPSPETLISIAHALEMTPETVFRAAGLLPNLTDPKEVAAEVLGHKLSGLSESQIEELIKYIDFMKDRDGLQGEKTIIQRRTKKTREGSHPPEVVNNNI